MRNIDPYVMQCVAFGKQESQEGRSNKKLLIWLMHRRGPNRQDRLTLDTLLRQPPSNLLLSYSPTSIA